MIAKTLSLLGLAALQSTMAEAAQKFDKECLETTKEVNAVTGDTLKFDSNMDDLVDTL